MQSRTFVVIGELTLTHHYHSESIVYILFLVLYILWVWTAVQWHGATSVASHRVFSLPSKSSVLYLTLLLPPPTALATTNFFLPSP